MKMIIFITLLYSAISFAATKLTIIDIADSKTKTEKKTDTTQIANSINAGIFGNDPFKKKLLDKTTKNNKKLKH